MTEIISIDTGSADETVICVREGNEIKSLSAQPKYKRVDLGLKRESVPIDYKDGSHREWEIHNAAFNDGWNEAIDDIKSKYGDLFIEIKE